MKKIYTKILGALLIGMVCWTPSVIGEEQSYDIKEMTPQVLSALEGRRDRYDQLNTLKENSILGENNKGYVEVLKEEGNAVVIAEEENVNRKTIYQTIADQNNLTDELLTIEKIFALVQRDKASPGNMIQTEDGQWEKKEGENLE